VDRLSGRHRFHSGAVLGLVLIADDVSLGVEGFFEKPAEDTKWVGGIGNPAVCRLVARSAVNAGDVVLGDGAPMDIAITPRPALDAGEKPLGSRPTSVNRVARDSPIFKPGPVGIEDGNRILCRRQDEDVRVFGIPIAPDTLVGLSQERSVANRTQMGHCPPES
jgi:hypothetical protein